MKLPFYKEGATQSLGREDIGQRMAEASAESRSKDVAARAAMSLGQDIATLGRNIAQVSMTINEARQKTELARVLNEIDATAQELATKPAWTAEEAAAEGVKVTKEIMPSYDVGMEIFDNRVKAIVEKMDPAMRRALEGPLQEAVMKRKIKLNTVWSGQAIDAEKEKALEEARKAVDNGRPDVAKGIIDASPVLQEDEKIRARTEIRKTYAMNEISRTAASRDPQRMMFMAEALLEDNYAGPLNTKDRTSMAIMLRNKARSVINERRAERARRQADSYAEILYTIEKEPSWELQGTLTKMRDDGLISTPQWSQASRLLMSRMKAKDSEETLLASVETAMSGSGYLDPSDPKARKAVDLFYQKNGDAKAIVMATGIMPGTALSRMKATVANGDPMEAAQMVAEFAEIEELKPQATAGQGGLTQLKHAAALYRAGMDPIMAVNKSRETVEVKLPLKKTEWRKELSDRMDDDPAVWEVEVNWFPNYDLTKPTEEMTNDFALLTNEYYQETGNQDIAMAMAYNDIRGRWGLTTINGEPQAMRYPPERILTATPDEVAEALQRWKERVGLEGDIIIASDSRTPLDKTWVAVAEVKDDEVEPLISPDGSPVRVNFDIGLVRERKTNNAMMKAEKTRDTLYKNLEHGVFYEKEDLFKDTKSGTPSELPIEFSGGVERP